MDLTLASPLCTLSSGTTLPGISASKTPVKVGDLEVRVRNEDLSVLQSLPNDLIERLKGKNILIVDDFELDLVALAEKLAPLTLPLFNCTIEIAHDPQDALERWHRAARSNKPFDLLISDLWMRTKSVDNRHIGMNGDELVKKMNRLVIEEKLRLPPVVYHSGSHAEGLQGYVFGQIERLKHQDSLPSENEPNSSAAGIPITLVHKSASALELWHAMHHVLSLSAHIPPEKFSTHVAQLNVKFYESDLNTENTIQAQRIVAYMKKTLKEAFEAIDESGIEDKDLAAEKEDLWSACVLMKQYTLDQLLGPNKRFLIHQLGSLVSEGHSSIETACDICGALAENSGDKKISELRDEFLQFSREYNLLVDRYNSVGNVEGITKKSGVSLREVALELQQFYMQSDVRRVVFQFPDDLLMIGGLDGEILKQLICQPLNNAFAASSESTVNVSAHIRVSESLPPAVAQFFSQPDASKIAENGIIEICIADDGPGIPAEVLAKVLEGKSVTTKKTGRGGWGMSFLKKELARFGGTLFIESSTAEDSTRGTKFSLYFRLLNEKGAG